MALLYKYPTCISSEEVPVRKSITYNDIDNKENQYFLIYCRCQAIENICWEIIISVL